MSEMFTDYLFPLLSPSQLSIMLCHEAKANFIAVIVL